MCYVKFSICADLAFGYEPLYSCNNNIMESSFNSSYNCCSIVEPQYLDGCTNYFRELYAYNAENITIQQQWISSVLDHYHTDIELAITNFNRSTGKFEVKSK